MANSLRASGLAAMFKTTMSGCVSNVRHSRSLLFNHWIDDGPDVPAYFRHLALDHGLPYLSREEIQCIAGDEQIRYCPQCMDQCYHSIFFQIDGLKKCPIHKCELQDRCQHCGQLTGPYPLTPQTINHPYQCHHCEQPYGCSGAPASLMGFLSKTDLSSFEPIHAFLKVYGAAKFSWEIYPDWLGGRYVHKKTKRIAAFKLLMRLLPNTVKADDTEESFSLHILEQLDGHPAFFPGGRQFSTFSNIDREHVFHEVDRYIVDHVNRGHELCHKGGVPLRYFRPSQDLFTYFDGCECPLSFGYEIWRHHFETTNKSFHFELRNSIKYLPYSHEEFSNEMWAAFCLCAYFSYVEVARKWVSIVKRCNDGLSNAPARQNAFSLLAPDLDYRERPLPATITYLSYIPPGDTREKIIIVVAEEHISMEVLLGRGC